MLIKRKFFAQRNRLLDDIVIRYTNYFGEQMKTKQKLHLLFSSHQPSRQGWWNFANRILGQAYLRVFLRITWRSATGRIFLK